jgi:starch synthase
MGAIGPGASQVALDGTSRQRRSTMHVVMAAAEAVPFAKTGGLADVCGTLPLQLAQRGHHCSLFMPAYRRALHSGAPIVDTHISFIVDLAGKPMAARILKTTIGDNRPANGNDNPVNGTVDIYFVDQPLYFDREQLYGDEHGDYRDNCERFCFFSRCVVEAIERLKIPVDVVHCHDWQTGLIPAYLRTQFGNHHWYSQAASVMTVHNLAYQGRFWQHDMALTGLDWQYFNWQQMEFYGDLNMLKSGISFADFVTTVSPSYAKEIQTPAHGCGLDGVLRAKGNRMSGIVNGVDYRVWDPIDDSHLPLNYSSLNWKTGKSACKSELQKELGLPLNPTVPMIGLIGRLAEQKGWDLVKPLLETFVDTMDVQWVILGNGEARFANALSDLANRRPDRVAVRLEFSDALAHRIEAGSDMFLMPSRYEPCGLNQLYSLRYGTVPVVHATGGLVDTVRNYSAGIESESDVPANGFSFASYDMDSLKECVERAIDTYSREPQVWDTLVAQGMSQDWSWTNSAIAYESAYRRARELAAIEGRL